VKGRPKLREKGGPPGLGPGGWARHGSVGGDEGLDPIGVGIELFFKGIGRADGRRGRGNQGRESGEDTRPVRFQPVRGRGWRSEPGRG